MFLHELDQASVAWPGRCPLGGGSVCMAHILPGLLGTGAVPGLGVYGTPFLQQQLVGTIGAELTDLHGSKHTSRWLVAGYPQDHGHGRQQQADGRCYHGLQVVRDPASVAGLGSSMV